MILDTIRKSIASDPKRYSRIAKAIRGVSEETTGCSISDARPVTGAS